MKHFLWIAALMVLGSIITVDGQIRVACVGNSITYGSGIENREVNSYPAQLSVLLGADWEVKNFGVGGSTLLNQGDKPYQDQEAFSQSLLYNPDVVVIKLGTNDSKPQNWQFKEAFIRDYQDLIQHYQSLPSRPMVVLCLPVPAFEIKWGINPVVIRKEVVPMVRKTAQLEDLKVINLNRLLKKESLFPDKIHPDAAGAALMAEKIARVLKKQIVRPDTGR